MTVFDDLARQQVTLRSGLVVQLYSDDADEHERPQRLVTSGVVEFSSAEQCWVAAIEWDRGNEYFSPTSFQISDIHAGTGANNVIPGTLDVMFNFRYSTESTADQLKARVHTVLDAHGLDYELKWALSGPPFLSPRGGLVDVLTQAVTAITGVTPTLSTTGGTSDGRFLASVSREVVEFGPLSASIHGIDEHVRIADIGPLTAIYERTIAALLT